MFFLRFFLTTAFIVIILIIGAGIYKFGYLSSRPGYDVDGNKIENTQ